MCMCENRKGAKKKKKWSHMIKKITEENGRGTDGEQRLASSFLHGFCLFLAVIVVHIFCFSHQGLMHSFFLRQVIKLCRIFIYLLKKIISWKKP